MEFCYRHFKHSYEYRVYNYVIPVWMERHVKFLERFFNFMDSSRIPFQFKRRKSSVEAIESALMLLGRIDQMMMLDIPIVVGSKYLMSQPWATFGGKNSEGAMFHIKDFDELAGFYSRAIVDTRSFKALNIHFRNSEMLPFELSRLHHKTPYFIVALAINFACDVIKFAGPDCVDLKDFFNNDKREDINIEKWGKLRKKIMGHSGIIKEKPFDFHVGQVGDPIPLLTNTYIEEISCENICDDVNLYGFEQTEEEINAIFANLEAQ